MQAKKYTIQDICEISGYSRRTIRFYIEEGLLDPPAGRGRGGFYFDSHLKRLSEIRTLQDQGLKLNEILKVLEKGEAPEVSTFLRDIWIRYPVKPGIEIHINRELEGKEREKIADIIHLARSILNKGGSKHE